LSKNPEDYPDAKSQPHVQVALRMKAKGGSARSGNVISYIFCLAEGEETAKTAQADRARHPDEVRKANSGFQIGIETLLLACFPSDQVVLDFEHYLANQVLPPIERLCDPIEGTDRPRLAECLGTVSSFLSRHNLPMGNLGLDPDKFRSSSGGSVSERSFASLDSQMSDAERFKDASPFLVRCRHCQGELSFAPLNDRKVRALVTYAFRN
jgi:DNA polymerase alpha subunit A